MDSVFVEGLRLFGKHGVHPREREENQEFVVDIRVSFATRKAALSDDLADTIDYTRLAAIVQDVVEQNSFYLIERLADAICFRILEDKNVSEVSVTVRKPAALRNGVAGCTIVRNQS